MAAPCFLPAEIEADQALRLRADLMVIGVHCKDPSYTRFIERNQDTLSAYEQILGERFERSGPDAAANLQAYLAQLERQSKARAEQSPSFCADALELVETGNTMRPDTLRTYASARAEAARQTYAVCTEPNSPPATAVATAQPSVPPPIVNPPDTAPPAISAPAASPGGGEDDVLVTELVGTDLARMLDPVDRRRLQEVVQQTLENGVSGQVAGWRNPFSRNNGTVVASRAYRNASGLWCRGVEQSITVSQETRRGRGTACRRPDGFWDIQP
jgi:surface antigen